MSISKRILAFVLYFFATLFVSAQKNKKWDGYFISLKKDTVRCTFKDRNWKKQPYEFTVVVNNKDSVLLPQSVSEVNIRAKELTYASRIIKPAKYIDNIQHAHNTRDADLDTPRHAFVKTLHQGKLNLYLYTDKVNMKHFLVEDDDNFLEMYLHYYTDIGGFFGDQPIVTQNKQYEFILKTLMTPCRTMFSIIENIRLEEDHLIQLFTIYDRCMDSKKE